MPKHKKEEAIVQLNLFAEQEKDSIRAARLVDVLHDGHISNLKFIRTHVQFGAVTTQQRTLVYQQLTDALENIAELIHEISRKYVILSPERCMPALHRRIAFNESLNVTEPLDSATLADYCSNQYSRLNGLFLANDNLLIDHSFQQYHNFILNHIKQAQNILCQKL